MDKLLVITHPKNVVTPEGHISAQVFSGAMWWMEAKEDSCVDVITLPQLHHRDTDRKRWRPLADEALRSAGYVRIARWRTTPQGGLAARIAKHEEPVTELQEPKEDDRGKPV